VKKKQANGVGTQYSSHYRGTALLPTIKTYDMLPSSMVSRELSSKIRELVSISLFPCNTFLTGIKTEWPVDTVSSVVSSITRCH